MTRILVGTAGWNYKDWVGNFYPKNVDTSRQLEYYAKFFNIVEINSSFYNIPSSSTVRNWFMQAPEEFRFIVKIWEDITHKIDDDQLDDRVTQFFLRMKPLEPKIYGFLFQFPPWFKYSETHIRKLIHLLNEVPINEDILYIFELRDDSWFAPGILSDIINGRITILGTTYKPGMNAYYLPNQNSYYIRMIGDRDLNHFDRIQRKQETSVDHMVKEVQELKEKPNVYEIFIIVNNHFQGFAPESANIIRKKLNIPIKRFDHQQKLSDFF